MVRLDRLKIAVPFEPDGVTWSGVRARGSLYMIFKNGSKGNCWRQLSTCNQSATTYWNASPSSCSQSLMQCC